MDKKYIGIILVVLVSLVLSCSPQPVPASQTPTQAPTKAVTSAATSTPQAQATVKPTTQAPAKPTWQAEWDKTVAEAKTEGKLVIACTGGAEVKASLDRAFREKFGIDVEWLVGRGAEISSKIFAERKAGLYLADIYIAGATTPIATFKPAGVLAPIKPLLMLPDVIDPKAYFDDGIPYVDKEGSYIICHGPYVAMTLAINSDIVKPGEVKGYADLLDPKWKDKVAFSDPSVPGAASRCFLMTANMIMSPDYHRQLAKQNPLLTRDVRQQTEWVARGKYPIALAPYVDAVADFQKAGAPIKWVSPVEGVYLSSGASGSLSYFSQAPHPNAAKVFVNWFLTKEALTVWSKSSLTQSARKDVPTDFLYPEGIRDPKVKYFNSNTEEVLMKEEAAYKLAREIYGPLMK